MTVKRKVVSTLFASGMLLACLSGCGKEKVTAEDLISNASKTYQEAESMDADFALDLDFDVDAGGLFGSTDDDSDDSGTTTTMNTAFTLDGNIRTTEDVSYLSGDVVMTMFGMTVNSNMEMYVDNENSVSYSRDSDSENWAKEEYNDAEFDFSKLATFNYTDLIEDIVLTNEDDKEAATYDVTGTISYDKLHDLLGGKLEETTEDTPFDLSDAVDTESLKFKVTMKFDRNTKELKSYTMSMDPFETYDGTNYNKFAITMDINSVNDVTISIPDSVKENAIDASSVDDEIDSDMSVYPEDYSVESTEETTEE